MPHVWDSTSPKETHSFRLLAVLVRRVKRNALSWCAGDALFNSSASTMRVNSESRAGCGEVNFVTRSSRRHVRRLFTAPTPDTKRTPVPANHRAGVAGMHTALLITNDGNAAHENCYLDCHLLHVGCLVGRHPRPTHRRHVDDRRGYWFHRMGFTHENH